MLYKGISLSKFFLMRLFAALLSVIFIAGCASKFHHQPEVFERRQHAMIREILSAQRQITDFNESGTITIAQDGKRSSGKCDVRLKPDGSFRAQVYSPFGTTALRIDADSLDVRLRAGKDEYSFALDESSPRELPFGLGYYFTFRQLIQILAGNMPKEAALLDTRPDSLVFDKSYAAALWNRDALILESRISRKSEILESVTFNYNIEGDTFTLRFARFKNGIPGEITIRSDSKNYILLRYDR